MNDLTVCSYFGQVPLWIFLLPTKFNLIYEITKNYPFIKNIRIKMNILKVHTIKQTKIKIIDTKHTYFKKYKN